MPNVNEISKRIKSIQDTMKITKAMYLMASMKLRKAKQKLENTEPYFYGIQDEIRDICLHFPDMEHRFLDSGDVDTKKAAAKAYIVVTGDKGMAGAYNHNVLKQTLDLIDSTSDYRLFVVGELGRHFLKNQGYKIETDFKYSASEPNIHRAQFIMENIIQLYEKGEISEVDIIYTRMVNSMRMEVETQRVLPLKTRRFIEQEELEKLKKNGMSHEIEHVDEWYYIYSSPERVLEKLVHNYVAGFLYSVLVECYASEENARMIAMQSATDNANKMLRELSMEFNRIRQAMITQEITEVIGGAKALRKKKMKRKK